MYSTRSLISLANYEIEAPASIGVHVQCKNYSGTQLVHPLWRGYLRGLRPFLEGPVPIGTSTLDPKSTE